MIDLLLSVRLYAGLM